MSGQLVKLKGRCVIVRMSGKAVFFETDIADMDLFGRMLQYLMHAMEHWDMAEDEEWVIDDIRVLPETAAKASGALPAGSGKP